MGHAPPSPRTGETEAVVSESLSQGGPHVSYLGLPHVGSLKPQKCSLIVQESTSLEETEPPFWRL